MQQRTSWYVIDAYAAYDLGYLQQRYSLYWRFQHCYRRNHDVVDRLRDYFFMPAIISAGGQTDYDVVARCYSNTYFGSSDTLLGIS